MDFVRKSRGFLCRLGWSTALALFVLDLWVLPLGLHQSYWKPLLAVLNAPVSAPSLLLPCTARPLDFPFGACQHWGYQSASETFVKHLRLAVPAYLLLLYTPTLVLMLWQGLRRKRK